MFGKRKNTAPIDMGTEKVLNNDILENTSDESLNQNEVASNSMDNDNDNDKQNVEIQEIENPQMENEDHNSQEIDEKESFEKTWLLSMDDFGPLAKYITDDDITDIDWDCDSLWIRRATKRRERVNDPEVTKDFIHNLIERVAIHESVPFNPKNKSFCAETDTLRITCIHEELANSGRCINIRKSLPRLRFTAQEALENRYTSEKIMSFIINCIKMQANIVFCGLPGCGKTEATKFFSSFIPKYEKVITVEDQKEWHYKSINPGADAIELKVKNNEDYEEAIMNALRLTPTWLMITEARSKEVEYLKEGMTTGVHCITTLHTDDVRKIPIRIVGMMGNNVDKKQETDELYMVLDLGIHLTIKEDSDGFIHREIDQICYYDKDLVTSENMCHMIVDKGQLFEENVPDKLRERVQEAIHSDDIFSCKELKEKISNN